MPESFDWLLDKADLAIAAARHVLRDDQTDPVAAAAMMLRRRLDYPEDILVVGVAGGTGSGKSSLVNAIASEEVAEAGGIRPTTERPRAVAQSGTLSRLEGYLAELGVDSVAASGSPPWLCLVDMPDTDSVQLEHRLLVGDLLPRVDAVIWVVDPEKYRDAALHHGYLEPLARNADRFLFALNQCDRLDDGSRSRVLSDLEDALREDGIEAPNVVAVAAAPRSGPALGVEELIEVLGSRRDAGVMRRALSDLSEAVRDLLESLGRPALDFEERMEASAMAAARALARHDVTVATDELSGLLDNLAAEAGGVSAERLRAEATKLPRTLQRISEHLRRDDHPSPGAGIDGDALDGVEAARGQVEELIVSPVRQMVTDRAVAIGLVNDLSLSIVSMRSRTGV